MKKIVYIILISLISQYAYSAGSDSSDDSKSNYYDDAKKLVKRAGKLEKKEKTDKAKKLYSQAFKKLEKAHSLEKENPDILCLQENKVVTESFPREPFEDLGYNLIINGQKSYNGVATLSKFLIEESITKIPNIRRITEAQ